MKLKFNVTGMTCAACSARVEKVTNAVPGVRKAEVNLLAGTMQVEAESAQVTAAVITAVQKAGYGAFVPGENKAEKKDEKNPQEDALKEMKKRIIGSFACLIVLMYFTMGHMIGLPEPHWYHGTENALVAALLQFFLTLPPVYLNRVYYSRGLKALWNKAPNMDSLIAVGSIASLAYGIVALFRMAYGMGHGDWALVEMYRENLYFESAAMILTLITLGKFLETRAKGRTGDAICALMDLSPKTATVRRNGVDTEIPVEEVQVGDVVIVRSGGSVPVDGTVLEGRASVDQSALTGESVPVEKLPGDTVAAATINTEGYLEFRADKVGEDTTLAQVIRMVEEAGGSKAPIARLADKIAGIFVPVVMGISVITLIVWMLMGYGLEFALNCAISVLVISCPCALGLATPVAIMVGTGRGAQMGVLFKNAEALENLHHIDTVVLDKTGTLTTGKPEVTDILPGSNNADDLMRIAAALESKSEHPFAKAILKRMGSKDYPEAADFETLPGRGVAGTIQGIRYYGGNGRLMQELGVAIPELPELAQVGKTPLHFASEKGEYLGTIAAADVLKEDSMAAVKAMQALHLDVVMLTGDNEKTAKAIAAKAGITHVISDVLPTDKAGAVQQLQKENHRVLMVGDGINDAPALVTADVGMAIGAGTDIAMESADIVLMNSSLAAVSGAIELSKATIRNIRENLFWAFFYNTLGIPLAAGLFYLPFGLQLSPMIGAAAMSLSSVFVVSNALRLRFFKPRTNLTPACACAPAMEEVPIPAAAMPEEKPAAQPQKEIVIHVNGMMCSHCTASVEAACKKVPGTVSAVADLEKKIVTVTGSADEEALKQAIREEDYEVVEEPKPQTITIGVGGMMCSHCTASVEAACKKVPGTISAVADLEKKCVTVTGNADLEALKKAIKDEDYEILEG
ncbi:MAG: heavy metal translocating P-type ATPase [Oscillospiraceae bacterium]|nr:heavy metal translocating P-type ATPase [Oscillospiraceae bacterium]